MKTVVLYGEKMNYDKLLDFSILSEEVDVYDDADEAKLLERIRGADVLITKENPVTAEMLEQFHKNAVEGSGEDDVHVCTNLRAADQDTAAHRRS